MHRVIRDHLEEVLAEAPVSGPAKEHLTECEDCRTEVGLMRAQAGLLRTLRPAEELDPRPGFYARVMERIENEGAVSIWNVFSESPFGRRIAAASMALALAIGVYLYTSEQPEQATATRQVVFAPSELPGEDQPGLDLTSGAPDRDAVLVNLVTYREQ
jgi:hypothetical protein